MIEEFRKKVIASFDRVFNTFSHEIPFKYTNFIDGQAWLGITCGAVNHDVGKDSRNFAPCQVKESWINSKAFPELWYKKKPQSFAGPCAVLWAINQGAALYYPENKRSTYLKAKILCMLASPYGYLIKYVKKLRQHINTFMFAHLLLEKRPPESMRFLSKDNMIYSYIYRVPCQTLYKNTGIWPAKDYPDNEEVDEQEYTPICNFAGLCLQKVL
jgi:hypothetical protein